MRRALTANETLQFEDIERIWLLPLGADPGPVPPNMIADLLTTLERGEAVVVCGTHEEAVDVAPDLICDMVEADRPERPVSTSVTADWEPVGFMA